MSDGMRLSAVSGVVVAFCIALAPPSVFAQIAGWRALRIDGSSPETFQASVASLQNALPASRRAEFEAALAVLWLGNTAKGGDVDKDGNVEVEDIHELRADTADLLADIQRGDLVAAIEDLEVSGGGYTSADYFEQLDGLGHDEVLELAGRPGDSSAEGRALWAYKAQILCRDPWLPLRVKWCDAFFRSNAATPATKVPVGKTLNDAAEALNAGDTATAETAVGSLNLNQLTAFERGMAEALLFQVAYRQRLYPKAREHLQAAVDGGVMSEADAQAIVAVIDRFERMAARPGSPGQPVLGDPAGSEGESESSD
jgi:hypothetical protein